MTKYRNLTSHLASLEAHISRCTLSFQEIEEKLGFALPKSAYAYPAWWSNQTGDGHSQSAAWQSIGWRTGELDLTNQRVSFFRHEHAENEGRMVSRVPHKGGLTIAEAKAGLAAHFGVPRENVEITIKG
jgi:hypothetical protein